MRDFPLTFNGHEYNNIDFAYMRGYRDVYPDLLSDVPPSFDRMTVGNTGVSNTAMWTDLVTKSLFPEPANITIQMTRFKSFFPGQMLLFRDFVNIGQGGQTTQFYLRVKSYDYETGQLYGTIEGVQAPRDASTWVVTVAGSEVLYNAAKVMPFSAGGTGARATLQARDTIFANSLLTSIPEVFEDFTGFGDPDYGRSSTDAKKFIIEQNGGFVLTFGDSPVATLGTNWIGTLQFLLGTGGSDLCGYVIRNNVGSDYFGLMNFDPTLMTEFIARVYIPALGTGGNDYRINLGIFRANGSLTGDPGASGGFNLTYKNATNAGRWVIRSGGSSVTTTNTATAPVVGWNIMRILYDPTTANLTCYQNGVLIGTVAISGSNNIFTGSGGQDLNNAAIPGVLFYSDATNTSTKNFYLDYLYFRGKVLR